MLPDPPQLATLVVPIIPNEVFRRKTNIDLRVMAAGNFLTLRGTLRSDLDLRAFRYLVVTSQYRNPLNFNSEALDGARKTLRRLDKLRTALLAVPQGGGQGAAEEDKDVEELIGKALEGFEAGMRDDLNTPRAAAAMFTLVKGAEKMLKGTVTQAAATR